MDQTIAARVLAIALSSRGFGYAVLEGRASLVVYGATDIAGDRNIGSLARIDKMIVRNRPDILVLYDVNAKGVYRHRRIKELHRKVIGLAKRKGIKAQVLSAIDVRKAVLGSPNGTKYDVAESLARLFPDELASRLPRRRRGWESEDRRMATFEAVALAWLSGIDGDV